MKKEEVMRLFPLETERLIIRVAGLDDVDLIQNAKESVDADILRRWMSWTSDEGMSREGTISFLRATNDAHNTKNIPLIAVDKITGAHVLSTGLDAEGDDFQECGTGWWLSHGYESKGLAYEGMHGLLNACRSHTDIQKITSCYYEGNGRSQKLMERLGFIHIATTHKTHRCHLNGEMMDECKYELELRK